VDEFHNIKFTDLLLALRTVPIKKNIGNYDIFQTHGPLKGLYLQTTLRNKRRKRETEAWKWYTP
jgi:hypothetical protein